MTGAGNLLCPHLKIHTQSGTQDAQLRVIGGHRIRVDHGAIISLIIAPCIRQSCLVVPCTWKAVIYSILLGGKALLDHAQGTPLRGIRVEKVPAAFQ